jgi:hypothetical protein
MPNGGSGEGGSGVSRGKYGKVVGEYGPEHEPYTKGLMSAENNPKNIGGAGSFGSENLSGNSLPSGEQSAPQIGFESPGGGGGGRENEGPGAAGNEILRRMGVGSIEESKIEDERLRAFIQKVGSLPKRKLTREYLDGEFDFLHNLYKQANIQGRYKKFDDSEYEMVMGALNDWIEGLDTEVGGEGNDSFLRIWREKDELDKKSRTPEEDRRLLELQSQIDKIVSNAEEQGEVDDVYKNVEAYKKALEDLKVRSRGRDFKRQEYGNFARQMERLLERARDRTRGEKRFKGVREYLYGKEVGPILDEARKLAGSELSENLDEQRRRVRAVLNRIEEDNVQTYRALIHTDDLRLLNEFTENPKLDPELRSEIKARLDLHDCFISVKGALLQGGKDKRNPNAKTGDLFVYISSELGEQNRLLSGQDFKTLLHKMRTTGIDVLEAFNQLQKAAMEDKIFKKGLSETAQKQAYEDIENYLAIREARKRDGVVSDEDRENARKAVQLAERLAWATLEVSVWNDELQGIDPVAGAFYLKELREGRALDKDRGPEITLGLIPGLGTSFFRGARVEFSSPEEAEKAKSEKRKPPRLARARKTTFVKKIVKENGKDREVVDEEVSGVDLSDADFDRLGTNAYGIFLGRTIPRILIAKELFLKSEWKPEELDMDHIEGTYAEVFDTLDPDRGFDLRATFILGVFYQVSRFTMEAALDWGWSSTEVMEAKDFLTKPIGVKKENGDIEYIQFLTENDWDRIQKVVGLTGVFGRNRLLDMWRSRRRGTR